MRLRKVVLATVLAAAIPGAAAAAIPSTIGTPAYPWIQPAAAVGVAPTVSAVPQPVSYPWVQPPAWIPVG